MPRNQFHEKHGAMSQPLVEHVEHRPIWRQIAWRVLVTILGSTRASELQEPRRRNCFARYGFAVNEEVYILRYGEAILFVGSRFESCNDKFASFSKTIQEKSVIECHRVEE